MKKKSLIIVFILLLALPLLAACGGKDKNGGAEKYPPVAEGISVSAFPHKTEYFVGQQIDLSGGVIMLYYSDGSHLAKPMDDDISVSYDFSKAGEAKITIGYLDFETYFFVSVEQSQAAEIKIVTPPEIASFKDGEIRFDYTDSLVEILYTNGTSEQRNLSDTGIWKTNHGHAWNLETFELTVLFSASYLGIEDFCTLTLADIRPSYLETNTLPLLQKYFAGEEISLEQGTATLGNNGLETVLPLSSEMFEVEYDFSVPQKAEVTVRFKELAAEFSVTVLPAFDWDYIDELFEIADLAMTFSEAYGWDSEFLSYYYMICDYSEAVCGAANTRRIAEYESKYSEAFAKIDEYYSERFVLLFSRLWASEQFYDFIRYYSEVYFQYYVDGYLSELQFASDAKTLIDMFATLDEYDTDTFFLSVLDGGASYYYISDDYYAAFMNLDELNIYYYLFWCRQIYTYYLYDGKDETLNTAMNYMFDCIKSYELATNTAVFDGLFNEMYLKYKTIYRLFEEETPAGYDWNNLKNIIRDFARAYQKNDYILLIHYYNLLCAEHSFFEQNEAINPQIFDYYVQTEQAAVAECFALFDYEIKDYAPELFEGAGKEFVDYFSSAAYAYSNGMRGAELLTMVVETDRLRAELSANQRCQAQYYLVSYWYYFIEMHWDAYFPDLLLEDEADVYAYLLSSDAYYTDWAADVRDEYSRLAAYENFFVAMSRTELYYSRLSTESKANFDAYFGELYRFWVDIFHNL